jgi:hypothetical protein
MWMAGLCGWKQHLPTGTRFGRLVTVSQVYGRKSPVTGKPAGYVKCRCDCASPVVEIIAYDLRKEKNPVRACRDCATIAQIIDLISGQRAFPSGARRNETAGVQKPPVTGSSAGVWGGADRPGAVPGFSRLWAGDVGRKASEGSIRAHCVDSELAAVNDLCQRDARGTPTARAGKGAGRGGRDG